MPDYEPRESRSVIDPDKVTDNPGLLPYAHHVGSAMIAPIDRGRTRGLAMSAMYEQTEVQLNQLREQVEVLIAQAQRIHDRIAISESIYKAEVGFRPNISQEYYLYERAGGQRVLSLISPKDWRREPPYAYVASVRLLSDHTWDVTELRGEIERQEEPLSS